METVYADLDNETILKLIEIHQSEVQRLLSLEEAGLALLRERMERAA